MKNLKTLGLGVLLALSLTSEAALLAPGTVGPAPLQGPGPAPIAVLVSPFNSGGVLVGTVSSWVVPADPANPFGGLSFYYQVSNTGTESIGRFTASSFAGMPVDVATINVAWNGALVGGFAPAFADRDLAPGAGVGFDFLGGTQIPAGAWSQVLVVHTPWQVWTTGAGAVIDTRSANVNVLAPLAVPEPATMIAGALLLLPFGASTFRFFRKH